MAEIPIRPVLEHYGWELPPERYGWRTVKCFAHNDSHASARITEDEGGYVRCLACDFHGDAIDVVMHYEPGLEFKDARLRACEIAGYEDVSGGPGGFSGRSGAGGSRSSSRKRPYLPPRRRVSRVDEGA